MKKFLSLILVTLMLFAVVACGGGEDKEPAPAGDSADAKPAGDVITLTYAEVNPEDSLMGQTAKAFKEKVEELTDGSVQINIQFSGVMGAEGDVLDTMIGGGGTVDIARVATFGLTSFGAKKTSLLSVPYTFSGRDHFWKFAASDLGKEILEEPEELGLGIRGLFYVEEGFRHFFFKDEVRSLEDLKGKKLRVSTDPTMTGMVDGLQAYATVVSFNELYSALQTGVVDGAEQPIVNYQSNTFNEVAPWMILDGHTLGCAEVIITDRAWNMLSEDQQKAIVEAGEYTSDFNADLSAKVEKESMEQLEAEGTTFVPVDDISEWQDACSDIINKSIEGYEAEYQQILDMDEK